jgi:hypothetical protein
LIPLLAIPSDTFNLFHRWLGRIVVLEGLAHVFAWCIPKAAEGMLPMCMPRRSLTLDDLHSGLGWCRNSAARKHLLKEWSHCEYSSRIPSATMALGGRTLITQPN